MKIRNKAKNILSAALSAVMLIGSMPTLTFAAQVNEYVDPADIWVSANGRTNELDFNATITQETAWCSVCNKDTIMLTYRTPEYTKTGTTALNRGVKFSDGTMVDGETKGNLDGGRPNQDAAYTTYHWTKSICQTCGTINSIDGEDASKDLLSTIDGNPQTYVEYGKWFYPADLPLEAVRQLADGVPVTKELAAALNPTRSEREEIKAGLDKIGYPKDL